MKRWKWNFRPTMWSLAYHERISVFGIGTNSFQTKIRCEFLFLWVANMSLFKTFTVLLPIDWSNLVTVHSFLISNDSTVATKLAWMMFYTAYRNVSTRIKCQVTYGETFRMWCTAAVMNSKHKCGQERAWNTTIAMHVKHFRTSYVLTIKWRCNKEAFLKLPNSFSYQP